MSSAVNIRCVCAHAIHCVSYSNDSHPNQHNPVLFHIIFHYPLATDAIFVPGKVTRLRGNFAGEGGNSYAGMHRTSILRDSTGTLLNPSHNYTAVRYAGISR